MTFSLIRQDKAGRNERWTLDISDQLAVLTDPAGRTILRWNGEQVVQSVQFPSFSRSIKHTGFYTATGAYEFSMERTALKRLRGLANQGIAAGGPKAMRSVLIKAILTSVGGFIIFGVGVVMVCVTIHELKTGESVTDGGHPVGFVSAVVGLAVFCRGIYGLRQYSQMKKLNPSKQ